MADPPRHPDSGDDTSVAPGRGSTTGPPRWVKVFAIIAVVVIVLIVILLVARGPDGGGHGPGRHTGGLGGHTPRIELAMQQP
jgi:hypothetical protein